jgi:hypothetical protein
VNPLNPAPPHVIVNTPLVVVGSTDPAIAAAVSWHLQVFYQDTDSNFQGPGYRHLLILGARGGVRVYQLNTEHGMGDAETEVRGGGPVDVYGAKSERNFVVLWARNATRVRVWSYSGNAAAFAYNESASTYFGPAWSSALPSLFRFEACTPGCSLANSIDMGMATGGDVHKWSGMGVDPRVWHMVTWRATPGPEYEIQRVLGATVNGTQYVGARARTTGAPQNHVRAGSHSARGGACARARARASPARRPLNRSPPPLTPRMSRPRWMISLRFGSMQSIYCSLFSFSKLFVAILCYLESYKLLL